MLFSVKPQHESAIGIHTPLIAPPLKEASFKLFIFKFKKCLIIYLFLAVLGLHWLFSSCGSWASHWSGFSCWGARALELLYLWLPGSRAQAQELRLPGSRAHTQELWYSGLVAPPHVGSSWTGIRSVSPALAGWFLTTQAPGKP